MTMKGHMKQTCRVRCELTGFFPRICRIFPSEKIRQNEGKILLLVVEALHMVVDVSVTKANLNNASF